MTKNKNKKATTKCGEKRFWNNSKSFNEFSRRNLLKTTKTSAENPSTSVFCLCMQYKAQALTASMIQ